jgi:hypothetical protein
MCERRLTCRHKGARAGAGPQYELPGLRLSAEEIHAVLTRLSSVSLDE